MRWGVTLAAAGSGYSAASEVNYWLSFGSCTIGANCSLGSRVEWSLALRIPARMAWTISSEWIGGAMSVSRFVAKLPEDRISHASSLPCWQSRWMAANRSGRGASHPDSSARSAGTASHLRERVLENRVTLGWQISGATVEPGLSTVGRSSWAQHTRLLGACLYNYIIRLVGGGKVTGYSVLMGVRASGTGGPAIRQIAEACSWRNWKRGRA